MRVRIIGMGGIGSHLAPPLCRFLSSTGEPHTITFIDGDQFEAKNEERQEFDDFGNKAESIAHEMAKRFPRLTIEAKPHYVTEENIFLFIREEDLVFSCVDNHATRKLLSDYCETLQNCVLISGGNEFTDGDVLVYIRKEGRDQKPPITRFHPDIANPQDRNPAELSCEELAMQGSRQLIITNMRAAADMLATFWLILQGQLRYSEIYFDITTGAARAIDRTAMIQQEQE